MSLYDRAAQFSPFAALTGFGDAIKETARLTDAREELKECDIDILNARLRFIAGHIKEQPAVSVTYFIPDDRKAGGTYVTVHGNVCKLDMYKRLLVLSDGRHIPIPDISRIEGSIFDPLDRDPIT